MRFVRVVTGCAAIALGAVPVAPVRAANGTCYPDPDRAVCVYNTDYEGTVASSSEHVVPQSRGALSDQVVAGLCSYTGQPTPDGLVQYQLTGSATAASAATGSQPQLTDIKCTLTSTTRGLPGEQPTRTVSFDLACPAAVCASATTVAGWPRRPITVGVDGYAVFGPSPAITKTITSANVTSTEDVGGLPGGPTGGKCAFNSTTDVTREAGWQTGDIRVGPLVTGEPGRVRCRIIVNSSSHNSTNVRAELTTAAVDGVVVGASTLNYQATAADGVYLCTAWLPDVGTPLYWVPGDNTSGDLGHWSTNAADSCAVFYGDPNSPECSIWKAIDRRAGTNLAEIWQDCEPYEEFPLPI